MAAIGCHRASAPGPAQRPSDYRKLTLAELVSLIQQKLGNDTVALKAEGANHFTGTMKSPDHTIDLPIEVTVEAERILIVTKGGGLTSRQVITPRGLESDLH
jgi:hypothetical protein